MESLAIVLVSLLASGAAAGLAPALALLAGLLCRVLVVDAARRVTLVDRALRGPLAWRSARKADVGGGPADGVHLALADAFAPAGAPPAEKGPGVGGALAALRRGLVVAVRASAAPSPHAAAQPAYRLFVLGGAAAEAAVLAALNGDAQAVRVRVVETPSPYRSSTTDVFEPAIAAPLPWQQALADLLVGVFLERQHASVLIYGAPGVGKSRMAEVLAKALKARVREMEPIVVRGFDLTARGATVGDMTGDFSQDAPAIVGLDEFDGAVAHALRGGDPAGECSSLAKSRPKLLGTLDWLGAARHLVVIATMNRAPGELGDPAFTRAGRFDLHIEVTGRLAPFRRTDDGARR
jgi:hypothetical protein